MSFSEARRSPGASARVWTPSRRDWLPGQPAPSVTGVIAWQVCAVRRVERPGEVRAAARRARGADAEWADSAARRALAAQSGEHHLVARHREAGGRLRM